MRYVALLLLLVGCANAQTIVTLPNGLTPVPAPTFLPGANTYASPTSVVISDVQPSATIYYTIDSTPPSLTNGTQCPAPCTVLISTTLTLNAIATANGFGFSNVGSAFYNISSAPTPTPTFSVQPGTSINPFSITVNNSNGAAISYCTTDGSTPVVAVSPVCAVPVLINTPGVGPVTLQAISKAPGLAQSGVQSGVYTYQPPAATPAIAPPQGQYTSQANVSITDSCAGATIYWAVNATPTTASNSGSSPVSITVTTSEQIQAMATCPLYSQSAVNSVSYTIVQPIQTQTPTFQPNGGSSAASIPFQILDASAGAIIHYTTDGVTVPTSNVGTQCTAPCSLTATVTETVMAVADSVGASTSLVGSATFTIQPVGTQLCPQTAGGLTVQGPASGMVTRSGAGVSPLLIFFDATATTSSNIAANTTTFQDVTYTWNFGDSGASGSGTWAQGSNPNKNSTNSATGAIAAHLYITNSGGGDKTFTPTVTAQDGINTVTCSAPTVTVYDRHGTSVLNGGHAYGGNQTTCVAATTLPVKGVAGCPPGAAVSQQPSYVTALSSFAGSGKQVLFNCGDTFTGTAATLSGTNWAVGAYGGCEGTQVNRPIINGQITISAAAADGRVTDLDFETAGPLAIYENGNVAGVAPTQITLYNLNSNGRAAAYQWGWGSQWGLIGSAMQNLGANQEGVFVNYAENQCINSSAAFNCGNGGSTWLQSNYININYQALIGNLMNGASTSTGFETLRISACRLCVIENNLIENAGGTSYAVLKLHSGNTFQSNVAWIGQYTELVHVSDNLFTGNSGAQLVEVAPQNAQNDERLRNIVLERNLFNCANNKCLAQSGNNITARDNAFLGTFTGVSIARRGLEWNNGSGPQDVNEPEFNESLNNTCSGLTTCIGMNANQGGWGVGGTSSGSGSWAENNMLYRTSGGTTVNQTGNTRSGTNTVGNNTATPSNNPAFTNGSGAFSIISDFAPTANYGGAVNVPVFYDAVGILWAPTWELGALRHGAPAIPLITKVKYSGCTFDGLIGTIDAGSEATGVLQAGTQLTLFSQYVSLIGRSNCKYIGRAVDTYGWAPNFAAISANISAFQSQLDSNHIFGFYLAEKVWTTSNSNFSNYACTVSFCNGRNFIFGNAIGQGMCVSSLNNAGTQCESSWTNAEYVAYMTQITQKAIDLGFQVFLLGQVSTTDSGASSTGPLVSFVSAMRTYAASGSPASPTTVLFIAQHPKASTVAYLNSFDLVQGAAYTNFDGSIDNTLGCPNAGGKGGANCHIWLQSGFSSVVSSNRMVIEYDWFSNPLDDSSEIACISIPNNAGGTAFFNNAQSTVAGSCPLNHLVGSAVPITTTNFAYFKNQNIGFWLPGRQRTAFSPFMYSPINLTLAPSTNEAINYNDEGMLQIGNP